MEATNDFGLDKTARKQAEREAEAIEAREAIPPLNPRWPWNAQPFPAELFLQPSRPIHPTPPANDQ